MIEIKNEIANQAESSTSSTQQSQKRKVTIMVLVLVSVFVLCNIAEFVWWMLKTHKEAFNPLGSFTCFTEFALTLNSSVNVIIYGTFGEKFRKTFRNLFCSSCSNQNELSILASESIPLRGRSQITMTTRV